MCMNLRVITFLQPLPSASYGTRGREAALLLFLLLIAALKIDIAAMIRIRPTLQRVSVCCVSSACVPVRVGRCPRRERERDQPNHEKTKRELLDTLERINKKTVQIRMLFGPKQRVQSGRKPDHCDWPKLKESFDYVQTQWALLLRKATVGRHGSQEKTGYVLTAHKMRWKLSYTS